MGVLNYYTGTRYPILVAVFAGGPPYPPKWLTRVSGIGGTCNQ